MILLGGAMGFTPTAIREMDIHDFELVAEGFRIAKGGKRAAETCSDEELREMGIEV